MSTLRVVSEATISLGDDYRHGIVIEGINASAGADLSGVTATYSLYDEAGALAFGPEDCTMSGTTERTASYLLTTGDAPGEGDPSPAPDLTAEGLYHAVFDVSATDDQVLSWRGLLRVLPRAG